MKSIAQLVAQLKKGNIDWTALETGSTDGIFSLFGDLKSVTRSEYFESLPRGEYKDKIRSEDLQELTFASESIDAVIALDVFEHIGDPWKAFSEVKRVLKNGGAAIITVPIDSRVSSTRTLARVVNGSIEYLSRPAYHGDPMRPEGSLVFTEFGTDLIREMKKFGYDATLEVYETHKTKASETVIILRK